jgi:hypothetical protein
MIVYIFDMSVFIFDISVHAHVNANQPIGARMHVCRNTPAHPSSALLLTKSASSSSMCRNKHLTDA